MMTQIRLNSVVPNGVSGPEAGAINLIYSILLSEFQQNIYSYISINQIGEGFNEVIIKKGKKIYINVNYSSPEDFESKTDIEKNYIRLNVIHLGLLRIAAYDKKLDVSKLEAIKNKIVENTFSFDFVCKTYKNKKNKDLVAKLFVHPTTVEFIYHIVIEKNEKIICRKHIYNGDTSGYYLNDLFSIGIWKKNLFVLTGSRREVEIQINFDECTIEIKNLTIYKKSPFFEMFKTDNSMEDRDDARKIFDASLPDTIKSTLKRHHEN